MKNVRFLHKFTRFTKFYFDIASIAQSCVYIIFSWTTLVYIKNTPPKHKKIRAPLQNNAFFVGLSFGWSNCAEGTRKQHQHNICNWRRRQSGRKDDVL